MTQHQIIQYFNECGGLRCKEWTYKEIKEYVKRCFGRHQRVSETTCRELKRTAQINQQ